MHATFSHELEPRKLKGDFPLCAFSAFALVSCFLLGIDMHAILILFLPEVRKTARGYELLSSRLTLIARHAVSV